MKHCQQRVKARSFDLSAGHSFHRLGQTMEQ